MLITSSLDPISLVFSKYLRLSLIDRLSVYGTDTPPLSLAIFAHLFYKMAVGFRFHGYATALLATIPYSPVTQLTSLACDKSSASPWVILD